MRRIVRKLEIKRMAFSYLFIHEVLGTPGNAERQFWIVRILRGAVCVHGNAVAHVVAHGVRRVRRRPLPFAKVRSTVGGVGPLEHVGNRIGRRRAPVVGKFVNCVKARRCAPHLEGGPRPFAFGVCRVGLRENDAFRCDLLQVGHPVTCRVAEALAGDHLHRSGIPGLVVDKDKKKVWRAR